MKKIEKFIENASIEEIRNIQMLINNKVFLSQKETILSVVCNYFNLDLIKIKSKTNKREVTQPRHIAMYFLAEKTKMTNQEIGSYLGNFDHATFQHAKKTVKQLISVDKSYKKQIEEIETIIKNKIL